MWRFQSLPRIRRIPGGIFHRRESHCCCCRDIVEREREERERENGYRERKRDKRESENGGREKLRGRRETWQWVVKWLGDTWIL